MVDLSGPWTIYDMMGKKKLYKLSYFIFSLMPDTQFDTISSIFFHFVVL